MDSPVIYSQDTRVELVRISDLKPHPQNPNVGNLDEIVDSIRRNGFYGAVLVQLSTGYVLAGWHRSQAMLKLGGERVPVLFVDVDDDTALGILASDNQTNRLGGYDNQKLVELLQKLDAGKRGLAGTGFTNADLAARLIRASPPPDSPEAPAEFPAFDENVPVEFQCPRCAYEWSGKPRAGLWAQ